MKRFLKSEIITAGLAIFSMLFGAGNLIFPIKVGMVSAEWNLIGIAGFLITAVLLPIAGVAIIIMCDGSYWQFFEDFGSKTAKLSVLLCMLIIGPLLAMPRIVTLSYEMAAPFLPSLSPALFSVIFLGVAFLLSFRENKIVDLLGKFISPALLISLSVIVIKGLFPPYAMPAYDSTEGPILLLWSQIKYGYNTLDLLGTIFFSSLVIGILQERGKNRHSKKDLMRMAIESSLLGCALLGIIYVGLSYLGVLHGAGLGAANEGQIFSTISFKILGVHGAAIISLAVILACMSTIIALAAVLGEYTDKTLTNNRLGYVKSVAMVLLLTIIPSRYGLGAILQLSGPFINFFYPVLIVLTFASLAKRVWGFKYVKTTAAIATAASLISNIWV